MGLLNKLFGQKNPSEKIEKNIPWQRLSTLEQLDEIAKESINNPVAIFKHSTGCGVSRMVLRQFENNFNEENKIVKLYFLDLLAFREVSNEIAIQFQVLHQSPQLIIIKNGNTIHHSSHHNIDAGLLDRFL